MDWVRGDAVGRGSFATVSLAIPTTKTNPAQFPSLTAVKSAEAQTSYWLKNEKHVLDRLGSVCPRIIRCFGDDRSFENGVEYYNLFLEYAAGGSLADELKSRRGGRIPEPEARRYTRSILEGLNHVHKSGFVHCDIKLQNILVFDDGGIKIADFGLAKEAGEKEKSECRGTPMFMSPEQVTSGECDSPADIWALGCAILEMVTGKSAWKVENGASMWSLLLRIGVGKEVPEIPHNLSKEGKDFIEKCFVKDPKKRFSAEMLLEHPFVTNNDCTVSFKRVYESPRSHFDFPDWVYSVAGSVPSSPEFQEKCEFDDGFCSPEDRLRQLSTANRPASWSESDGWSSVR